MPQTEILISIGNKDNQSHLFHSSNQKEIKVLEEVIEEILIPIIKWKMKRMNWQSI